MLLIEFMNAIPVNNLTNHINFAIYPQENKELSKKLIDLGMKPTISNIKNYMLKWLTVPLDEVPQLERLIIMRSGRPERQ
jgi:hypothetical protein